MTDRPPIITDIKNVQALYDFLKLNKGLIIIKFGAEWCAPCKRIESLCIEWYNKMPNNVYCSTVDIDNCFELYGFLKTKRIAKGVPTILCYYKGTTTYIPDDMTIGADVNEIDAFFERCLDYLDNM
jgi:thiol-disulfide isomerase/thioredoxin